MYIEYVHIKFAPYANTPMAKVNITELRQNLPTYIASVAKGDEIEVVVRGKVIARIVPEQDHAREARERLRALRRNAVIGDVLSPIGEAWDAER